jgi:hypothetical protein
MHNRDHVDAGIDIMKDIAAFFERSLEIAAKAGISGGNIVLTPVSALARPLSRA